MCSIRVRIWTRPAPALAVVALSICAITAIVWLGPDAVATAFVDHLGSLGPRAGGPGQGSVPGPASVWYAVVIRATFGSRRDLSGLEVVPRAHRLARAGQSSPAVDRSPSNGGSKTIAPLGTWTRSSHRAVSGHVASTWMYGFPRLHRRSRSTEAVLFS